MTIRQFLAWPLAVLKLAAFVAFKFLWAFFAWYESTASLSRPDTRRRVSAAWHRMAGHRSGELELANHSGPASVTHSANYLAVQRQVLARVVVRSLILSGRN